MTKFDVWNAIWEKSQLSKFSGLKIKLRHKLNFFLLNRGLVSTAERLSRACLWYIKQMVYSQVLKIIFFSFFLQTDFSKPNQCESFKIIHPYSDVTFHHHEIHILCSSLLFFILFFFMSALDKYRHVFCMKYKKKNPE